jgi:hypothetical protein
MAFKALLSHTDEKWKEDRAGFYNDAGIATITKRMRRYGLVISNGHPLVINWPDGLPRSG